jgi:hypothetical protein
LASTCDALPWSQQPPLLAILTSDTLSVSFIKRYVNWLTGYDGVRLTSENRGHHWPTVHPKGECEWRAVLMTMSAGDNSRLVYQSSLAVLPPQSSGARRRNGRRSEDFANQYLELPQGIYN